MKFSPQEIVIIQAALIRYIDSLYMSNNRVLRSIGWKDSRIDCEDKLQIIYLAKNILKKVNEKDITMLPEEDNNE